MSYNIPSNIYDAIEPYFQGQVPDALWEDVAYVESGFNPQAVGDNGSSFGIFQLHRGGQLGSLTQSQAFDPATNARTAAPAIIAGYKAVQGMDPSTNAYWMKFAEVSGHPGGSDSDPATINEAGKLMQVYQSNGGTLVGQGQPTSYTQANSDCAAWNPGTYGDCLNDWVQSNFVQPIEQGAVKVGIFALAALAIVIGLVVLAKQ